MEQNLATGIVIGTLVVVFFIGVSVLLLVTVHARRIRHRAELAEAERHRQQEVMRAEREATQQTLREVGRELHDNVAQVLSVAQMGMNNVLNAPAADSRLVAARDALDRGIEEVRRLGHDLNSDRWQQRSLVDAISADAERIERVGRVRAHVQVLGTPAPLAADTSIILYRAYQEVVHNALKHSGADTLTITLDGSQGLVLTISDNGRGFDADGLHSNGGLLGIRKRCALVGYTAQCTSRPGLGCTWTLKPAPADGT